MMTSGPNAGEAARRRVGDEQREGHAAELPRALARLLANPRRLSARTLWRSIEEEERAVTLRLFIRRNKDRAAVAGLVARKRKFRPATVARMSNARIVEMAQPLQLPNHLAASLLDELHFERRREMPARFFDSLGIPHDEGVAEGSGDHDPGAAVVGAAADDLAREHGRRRTVVFLLMLAAQRVPFADHLWHWLQRSSQRPEAASGTVALPSENEPPEDTGPEPEPSSGDPEPAGGGPEVGAISQPDPDDGNGGEVDRLHTLRTLDRLLIEAMVDSRQGVEGSLDEDAIDDAVDEFVNLNGRRQQSFFHTGFRDVLFNRSLAGELPAENRTRSRWYWAGVILGLARLESWARIVSAYDGDSTVRSLGDGTDFAAHEAARHVVRALVHEGRAKELIDFVQVGGLVQSYLLSHGLHEPPVLFGRTLDAGTDLLRAGDLGTARAVFDRLMEAVGVLEDREAESASPLLLTVKRRHAHCLQGLLEHGRARELLKELLHLDPDPHHRAMVHADLGLLAGRFNNLDDVCLPDRKDALPDLIERLGEGREHFRNAVTRGGPYATHGHYCLGVLALAENAWKPGAAGYGKAEQHLARLQGQFTSPSENYSGFLVARSDLYFGIARAARASSVGDLSHAARVMVRAIDDGASFPPYLVDPVVEGLDLGARSELTNFANHLLGTQGDAVLDDLARSATVVRHCGEVVEALRQRAARLGEGEAAARDLRACLSSYTGAGRFDAARIVLDRLESLAVRGIGTAEFEELLAERGYQPAWEPEEALIARVRCLEARGKLDEALPLLRELLHQFATEGKLPDARGVLDRIRSYGLPEEYYDQARSRVRALEELSASPTEPDDRELAAQPASILFVGGDERQERQEAVVRRKVRKHAPNVEVAFVYSGWSGNWKQYLDRVRAELPKHDAVVVMRFMRTELGKQVRKLCGRKPWRSCWPAGQKGMARAIMEAAEAAWASRTTR